MEPETFGDVGVANILHYAENANIKIKPGGTITGWNTDAGKIFGYSAREAIGQNISMIIPDEIVHEQRDMSTPIKNGVAKYYETTGKTKKGSRIYISVTASPIKNNQGDVMGVSKIIHDITFQKLADEKQAILAAIVSSSDDAIVSKTLGGIITSWNNAAKNMFGYTEAEAIGKHISIIIPPDRIQEETVIIESIRRGEKIDHFETVRIAKDKSERNISLTISPIKNSNGEIIGASKVARDITARIEVEKQQRLYTERLQELSKYKDEFMVMASHELKTPLTVILANLQILQLIMEADPNINYVNKTIKQAYKLSNLMTNLLDVSKIQSGKLELNLSLFNVADLLKEVIVNLEETTKSHRIIFKDCKEKLMANADRERIEQVIINILGNAIKYTAAGDIIINAYKKDGKITISIRDNGIGIPQNDIGHIFERFYRVRGSASSFSGSGIGLYISSEIVKSHGGQIWAESEIGKGSVFYFSIPLSEP